MTDTIDTANAGYRLSRASAEQIARATEIIDEAIKDGSFFEAVSPAPTPEDEVVRYARLERMQEGLMRELKRPTALQELQDRVAMLEIRVGNVECMTNANGITARFVLERMTDENQRKRRGFFARLFKIV